LRQPKSKSSYSQETSGAIIPYLSRSVVKDQRC
jgi:hypothetical protein